MKKQIQTLLGLTLSLFAVHTSLAEDAVKPECATVVEHLTNEVKKDPTRLLLAVEDALTLNDKCACEIVSTAIKISKADSDMVGRIVTTSVQAAPTSASSIAECALAAAPKSADAVKKAMKAALGQGDTDTEPTAEAGDSSSGKEVVGKEPVAMSSGKEVVGKEPIDKQIIPAPKPIEGGDDYGSPMLNTSGVYLFTPAGGGITIQKETETRVIIRKQEKIKRVVIRESTASKCCCSCIK